MSNEETEYLPVMRWSALCNGVPIAERIAAVPYDTATRLPMTILGNGRYTSAATAIDLTLFNGIRADCRGHLTVIYALLVIEGMPVGDPSPMAIWTGDWPQAPCGMLHWNKLNRIWLDGHKPLDEYERFALMTERVEG